MKKTTVNFSSKSIISVTEINEFVKNYYRKFLTEENTVPHSIIIYFDKNVEKIDELFYSYLLLFIQDFPDIQIDLHFEDKDCKACQIAFQQVFFINTYSSKIKIHLNKEIPYVRVSNFTEFFPPLLVKENIDWFSLEMVNKDSGEIISSDANTRLTSFIQNNCTDIIKDFQNEKLESYINRIAEQLYEKGKSFVVYILYLYKDLGIFGYYIKKKINTNITLKDEKEQQKIYNILDIDNKNIVEVFLLRMLISKSTANQKKDIKFLKMISEQIYKTSFALNELAKNILEHSGKSFGVISGRIHRKKTLINVKNPHENLIFKEWIMLQNEKENFLDINVIDSGLFGIRKSYISNLEKIKGETIVEEEIKEDITSLKKENYLFSHFFDYDNIKLLHQIYRANARLGLLIFSEFVLNQKKGLIKVSSTHVENNIFDSEQIEFTVANKAQETNVVELGTNYNFIIPISESKTHIPPEKVELSDLTTSTSTLMELFKLSDKIKLSSITTDELNKYQKIDIIKRKIDAKEGEIVLINADEEGRCLQNSSDWIRFLANMQIINDTPIIVYNMDYNLYHEIININKLFEKTRIGFWNNKKNLLFYIKQSYDYKNRESLDNKERELSLWFCSVMSGREYNNFLNLNKNISRYHHNLFSIENSEINESNEVEEEESIFFTKEGKLLNFELLVKTENEFTLFEESVESLLKLEICTLPDILKNNNESFHNKDSFFHKFKGYKISKAHFRLGSKIHIDDFYYAKRLFYNSFYANRFAFLLATRIKKVLRDKKGEEVTLIGYDHYSELLVSNTRRLLNELGYKKINHDIVLDEGKVQKNANNIKKNIIVIIPISSTFSTSQKVRRILDDVLKSRIKDDVLPIIKDDYRYNTDINILLIADKEFKNSKENNFSNIPKFKNFEWNGEIPNLSKRINVGNSIQEYFIYLPTIWHYIDDCGLCFPVIPSDERCLLETGASSITPETIFGFPIIHHQSKQNQTVFNQLSFFKKSKNSTKYYTLHKHLVKEKLHFKQYIRAASFLYDTDNNKKIIEWLKSLRNNEYLNSNIVIITPSQNAKTGFVNLVNQYVFDETATVLSYSATDDSLQNFMHFNSSFFKNAYLIFVDDVLHSAQSFQKVNNLIKSVVFTDKSQRCVDKCICLVDRLNFFDRQNLLGNLHKDKAQIISFVEFNIPPLDINNYEFPDITKEKLFKGLAEKSVTDIMKIHFYELSKRIAPYDLDTSAPQYLEQIHTKDLFHFLICHALYDLFEIKEITEFTNYTYLDIISKIVVKKYEEAMTEILEFVEKNGAVVNFLNSIEGRVYKAEVKTKILYICSTPPFSDYKDIRELAFYWVRKELNQFVKKFIENRNNDNYFKVEIHGYISTLTAPFAYTEYQTFKLHLRLAVELKMNYVFSKEMFNAIQILLKCWNKEVLRYKTKEKVNESQKLFDEEDIEYSVIEDIDKNNKPKMVSPIGFITYYTGLIEQIICEDEAKSLCLVMNIADIVRNKDISPDPKFRLRKQFDNSFINLLRKLVLENTFIFNTFHECLYNDKKKDLKEYNFDKDDSLKFDEILKSYEGQTTRFQTLRNMIGNDEKLNKAFYKTMYLKTILKNEFNKKNTKVNIKNKVNIILKLLCEILGITREKCNGGAFFTVRYQQLDKKQKNIEEEDLFKISEYHSENEAKLKNDVISKDSILFALYKGINEVGSKKQKSIVELLYNNNEKVYSSTTCNINMGAQIEINGLNRYNNLLFLKISDIVYNEDNKFEANPLAVICFYRCKIDKTCQYSSHCKNYERRIDPKRLRLLLLVKEDLLKFIKYQISDGFRTYVEKQKQLNNALTSNHDYNSIIIRLKGFSEKLKDSSNKENFIYLLSLLNSKSRINKIAISGTFIKSEMCTFNIYEEINMAYETVFNNRPCSNVKLCYRIPNDLYVNFHPDIFRAIIYESFLNANRILSQISDKSELNISVCKVDKCVEVSIENTSKIRNISEADRDRLKSKGYLEKNKKGLYKNYLLLKAAECNPSIITISEPIGDSKLVKFNVKFKILNYE